MENQAKKEEKKAGFEVGIKAAYKKLTAVQYDQLLHDLTEACMTTEVRGASRSSYYNKRYGRTPLTQKEIAARKGISRSYVSRIEKKALEKLRALFEV